MDDEGTPFHLTGHKILITGASSGIGRASAVAASRMGAQLWISGRDAARLDETLHMLEGGNHTALTADLTDEADRAKLVDALPPLDGVVHSAGICKLRPSAFVTTTDFRETTTINIEAPILLTSLLVKKKRLNSGSSVVFLSSVSGLVGWTGLMSYAASKAALPGAARVFAVELARRRIRVNCISPGTVWTPMVKQLDDQLTVEARKEDEKRYLLGYGEPQDVANAVTFLLCPASRWITGTNMVVDGGYLAV